jgi:spore coat protein U-like protein
MSAASDMRAVAPRVLLAALAILLVPAARAAVSSCTVTVTGVAFGTYTPLTTTALPGTGSIVLSCTVTTRTNNVTIDLSTGLSNSYSPRTMMNGTYPLNYNLYIDAAKTEIWGNGTGGSLVDTVTLTSTGGGGGGGRTANATLNIYGAVAALQDPAVGSFTDTITVTVNY